MLRPAHDRQLRAVAAPALFALAALAAAMTSAARAEVAIASFAWTPAVELPLVLGQAAGSGTDGGAGPHAPPSSEAAGASTGPGDQPLAAEDPIEARVWGRPGSIALTITGGYADDFDATGIVPITVGFSWFPIKSVSIDLQAEGAYVSQPGDNAGGGGLALLIRWHFIDREQWSLYADLGVGFLWMSEPVPQEASDFVFTPRAGIGATYALDDATRLMAGVRWFHISNAQTASENPGIDAVQVYGGVSFGF